MYVYYQFTMNGASISQPQFSPADPIIVNGKANITFPSDYGQLAQYALFLINNDRKQFGLGNVSLSAILSGQQHADSMLYFDYFSHWDTQGYKPYMRYTLLGGTGAVSENMDFGSCTDSQPGSTKVYPQPCNLQTAESALAEAEWFMMNNDSVCCGNGHRDDILSPSHNRVSLGIAYNQTILFFVEDFENVYANFTLVSHGSDTYTLSASTTQFLNVTTDYGIQVFYDSSPSLIDPSQMNANLLQSCPNELECNIPYVGAYGPGTSVGVVLPSCSYLYHYNCSYEPTGYILVVASQWADNTSQVSITFSLAQIINTRGSGVYTIYLYPSVAMDPLGVATSISVFVSG